MLHYIQLNRNNRCDSSIHSAQKMTKKVHAGLKLHLFFIAKPSGTSVLLSNAVLTFDAKSATFHNKIVLFCIFGALCNSHFV